MNTRLQLRVKPQFLRAGSVDIVPKSSVDLFMSPSPHNRGGTGKLPKTTAEAMAIINSIAPRAAKGEPYSEADVHIHYMEAASNRFIADRYMFLGQSTLKNIVGDAVAGFAWMNCHRTGYNGELPIGRSFAARYETLTDAETSESVSRVVVGAYMLAGIKPNGDDSTDTDTISKGIDAGTIFDVSVGLYGGSYTCDICGNDPWEWTPGAYDEYGDYQYGHYACPHMPGTSYQMDEDEMAAQMARGVSDGFATVTLDDAHCGEVSNVYDGAVTGAGFAKALQFYSSTELPDVIREQIESSYKTDFARLANPLLDMENNPFSDDPEADTASTLDISSIFPGGEIMQPVLNHQRPNPKVPVEQAPAQGNAFVQGFNAALAALGFGAQSQVDAAPSVAVLNPAPAPVAPATVPVQTPAENLEMETLRKNLNDLQARLEAADKKTAEAESARVLAENKAHIETLKRQFKITPAQGDELAKLAESNPAAFEATKAVFATATPIPGLAGTQTQTVDGAVVAGDDSEALAKQLENKSREYMKENKGASYADAFSAVTRANPDLAKRYAESTRIR